MNTNKIVITGGPATGKSSIINELIKRNYNCLEEISRQVTLDARKDGVEQLFLTQPLLFSELLLKGRIQQYKETLEQDKPFIFLDRGIPDVLAYMDYIGDDYPDYFVQACENNRYDCVFILAPWKEIYTSDSERYENFDQAVQIHKHLSETYIKYGYKLINVPFGTIESRADYILNAIKSL